MERMEMFLTRTDLGEHKSLILAVEAAPFAAAQNKSDLLSAIAASRQSAALTARHITRGPRHKGQCDDMLSYTPLLIDST